MLKEPIKVWDIDKQCLVILKPYMQYCMSFYTRNITATQWEVAARFRCTIEKWEQVINTRKRDKNYINASEEEKTKIRNTWCE